MPQEPPPDSTQIREEFEASKNEATTREGEGPTRPEGHPSESSSPGWTSDASRVAQERSAFRMNEWANRPYAEHNASVESKQATQPAQNEDAQEIREIAEAAKAREDAARAREREQDKGR